MSTWKLGLFSFYLSFVYLLTFFLRFFGETTEVDSSTYYAPKEDVPRNVIVGLFFTFTYTVLTSLSCFTSFFKGFRKCEKAEMEGKKVALKKRERKIERNVDVKTIKWQQRKGRRRKYPKVKRKSFFSSSYFGNLPKLPSSFRMKKKNGIKEAHISLLFLLFSGEVWMIFEFKGHSY